MEWYKGERKKGKRGNSQTASGKGETRTGNRWSKGEKRKGNGNGIRGKWEPEMYGTVRWSIEEGGREKETNMAGSWEGGKGAGDVQQI